MMKLRHYVLSLVTALAVTASVVSTAPPTGTYTINNNGHVGIMTLTVNASGTVFGTAYGNQIRGFWDEASGRLVFYRAIGGTTASTPPELIQVFEGFGFSPVNGVPTRLAGHFQAFAGTGGTAVKNEFGWYAYK